MPEKKMPEKIRYIKLRYIIMINYILLPMVMVFSVSALQASCFDDGKIAITNSNYRGSVIVSQQEGKWHEIDGKWKKEEEETSQLTSN